MISIHNYTRYFSICILLNYLYIYDYEEINNINFYLLLPFGLFISITMNFIFNILNAIINNIIKSIYYKIRDITFINRIINNIIDKCKCCNIFLILCIKQNILSFQFNLFTINNIEDDNIFLSISLGIFSLFDNYIINALLTTLYISIKYNNIKIFLQLFIIYMIQYYIFNNIIENILIHIINSISIKIITHILDLYNTRLEIISNNNNKNIYDNSKIDKYITKLLKIIGLMYLILHFCYNPEQLLLLSIYNIITYIFICFSIIVIYNIIILKNTIQLKILINNNYNLFLNISELDKFLVIGEDILCLPVYNNLFNISLINIKIISSILFGILHLGHRNYLDALIYTFIYFVILYMDLGLINLLLGHYLYDTIIITIIKKLHIYYNN